MTEPPIEPKASPASYADFGGVPKAGVMATLVQFFAIPLLITCVAVGIFVGVKTLVGNEPTTALDFVEMLKGDTVNRRWQAAFEVSARVRKAAVQNGGVFTVPEEFRDPRLIRALEEALAKARRDEDPRPAQHLLLTLALIGDPASLATVRSALEDTSPILRSYALLALGRFRDHGSSERMLAMARDTDAGTRQAALLALALLDQAPGEPEGGRLILSSKTRELALELLGDRSEDVRFQAAIILGRAREREAALPVLKTMLDRERLGKIEFDRAGSGMDQYAVQGNLILHTLDTLVLLDAGDDPEVLALVQKRADTDHEGDPEVCQRARAALARWKKAP